MGSRPAKWVTEVPSPALSLVDRRRQPMTGEKDVYVDPAMKKHAENCPICRGGGAKP